MYEVIGFSNLLSTSSILVLPIKADTIVECSALLVVVNSSILDPKLVKLVISAISLVKPVKLVKFAKLVKSFISSDKKFIC
jgi:hypothetical protein